MEAIRVPIALVLGGALLAVRWRARRERRHVRLWLRWGRAVAAGPALAWLNRTHPDRTRLRWLAHDSDDGWRVVRVSATAGERIEPLGESTEARPKPPQAPDPRPGPFRDVGGPYAGG